LKKSHGRVDMEAVDHTEGEEDDGVAEIALEGNRK
jgi:hypothetical protein